MAYSGARDYKGARRANPRLVRWQDFGTGLGLGLVVALFAYGYAHRSAQAPAVTPDRPTPESRKPPASDGAATGAGPADAAQHYDFYSMLPHFEVVVPEKERDVRRDPPPAVRIERPGDYVLQAGSYRNEPDARRVATQLDRQGIDARVQRVAVDADVWYRVRIGPIRDLEQLNRTRRQLAAADVDALVIRVGD